MVVQELSISGENMRSSEQLSCQIGDKIVKAIYISPSAIECNTPRTSKKGKLKYALVTMVIISATAFNTSHIIHRPSLMRLAPP